MSLTETEAAFASIHETALTDLLTAFFTDRPRYLVYGSPACGWEGEAFFSGDRDWPNGLFRRCEGPGISITDERLLPPQPTAAEKPKKPLARD